MNDTIIKGKAIHGYTIESYLGGGAFGKVYEVTKGGQTYAMKFFWPDRTDRLEEFIKEKPGIRLNRPANYEFYVEQFKTEKRVVKALSDVTISGVTNKVIPKIEDEYYSVINGEDLPYLVTEFVRFPSIKDLPHPLPEIVALEITRRFLHVLHALHTGETGEEGEKRYLKDAQYQNFCINETTVRTAELQPNALEFRILDWNGTLPFPDEHAYKWVGHDLWKACAFLYQMLTGVPVDQATNQHYLKSQAGSAWGDITAFTRNLLLYVLSQPVSRTNYGFNAQTLAEKLKAHIDEISKSEIEKLQTDEPDIAADIRKELSLANMALVRRTEVKPEYLELDALRWHLLKQALLADDGIGQNPDDIMRDLSGWLNGLDKYKTAEDVAKYDLPPQVDSRFTSTSAFIGQLQHEIIICTDWTENKRDANSLNSIKDKNHRRALAYFLTGKTPPPYYGLAQSDAETIITDYLKQEDEKKKQADEFEAIKALQKALASKSESDIDASIRALYTHATRNSDFGAGDSLPQAQDFYRAVNQILDAEHLARSIIERIELVLQGYALENERSALKDALNKTPDGTPRALLMWRLNNKLGALADVELRVNDIDQTPDEFNTRIDGLNKFLLEPLKNQRLIDENALRNIDTWKTDYRGVYDMTIKYKLTLATDYETTRALLDKLNETELKTALETLEKKRTPENLEAAQSAARTAGLTLGYLTTVSQALLNTQLESVPGSIQSVTDQVNALNIEEKINAQLKPLTQAISDAEERVKELSQNTAPQTDNTSGGTSNLTLIAVVVIAALILGALIFFTNQPDGRIDALSTQVAVLANQPAATPDDRIATLSAQIAALSAAQPDENTSADAIAEQIATLSAQIAALSAGGVVPVIVTDEPTEEPTQEITVTDEPTEEPTQEVATDEPAVTQVAVMVTEEATATETPTDAPTDTPTEAPTDTPTETPTDAPTATDEPTNTPTPTATDEPTNTPEPTDTPTPTNTVQVTGLNLYAGPDGRFAQAEVFLTTAAVIGRNPAGDWLEVAGSPTDENTAWVQTRLVTLPQGVTLAELPVAEDVPALPFPRLTTTGNPGDVNALLLASEFKWEPMLGSIGDINNPIRIANAHTATTGFTAPPLAPHPNGAFTPGGGTQQGNIQAGNTRVGVYGWGYGADGAPLLLIEFQPANVPNRIVWTPLSVVVTRPTTTTPETPLPEDFLNTAPLYWHTSAALYETAGSDTPVIRTPDDERFPLRILSADETAYTVEVILDGEWQTRFIKRADLLLPDVLFNEDGTLKTLKEVLDTPAEEAEVTEEAEEEATNTASDLPTVVGTGTTNATANLRNSPVTGGVVASLPVNTPLQLIGRAEGTTAEASGRWYRAQWNSNNDGTFDQTGWVAAFLVTVAEGFDPLTLPVVEGVTVPAPTPAPEVPTPEPAGD